MFIVADQIVLHAIGDYVLQSDWMATEKTKRSIPALAHAVVYTFAVPFAARTLVFTVAWVSLGVIAWQILAG